jgi:glycosyltransferase involved in cell wall biosynthesis
MKNDSDFSIQNSQFTVHSSKRVLWLPRWYPNKFDPFDGNFVEAHARIASEVCNLAVLFMHSDPDLKKPFEVRKKKDAEKGFPVVRVYFKKPDMSVPGLSHLLLGIRFQMAQRIGYAQLKADWGEPDCCHIHVLGRTAWLARKLGKPYFITEHSSRYFTENPQFKGRLRKWWTKRVVRDAKAITVVSVALRKAMESHEMQGNYSILPNIVRTDLFQPGEVPAAPPWRFVHISTMHDVPKNTGGILQAFAALKERGHHFRLDMLGDGPEREKQEARSKALGLEEEVRFWGNVALEQVAERIRASHALVMFSWYETQSIVVLEAYASGLPVVATPVGGLKEHLHTEYAMQAQAGEVESLTEAIEKLMENYEDFDRDGMRDYVVKLASAEAIREAFGELYS